MALSNKERQRRYREKQRLAKLEKEKNSENEPNPVAQSSYVPGPTVEYTRQIEIPTDLAAAIARIAKFRGISEVKLLETFIYTEERFLLAEIWSDSEAKKRYFGWD